MSLNSLYILLHVMSVVVWVGGMFFAHQCLRPVAASQLEPPVRLKLWVGVFGRFFPFVWVAVILLPLTGWLMIFGLFGGQAPLYVHLMNGIGTIMILIFLHVFFAPYRRLKQHVANGDWKAGGAALASIRKLVGFNTILGFLVIAIASGGRFFAA